MSVTSAQFVADDRRQREQIEKIVHSQTLRKAESLCKLLRYLADHALAQPGVPLKEYQIATEVFGRPHNFDPQVDSAVRVQAGRLRLKLLDYYAHEGLADDIIVEMPNGSYALSFRAREPLAPVALPAQRKVVPLVERRRPRHNVRGWIIAVVILSFALVVALAAVADLSLNSAQGGKRNDLPSAGALRAFWSRFDSGPDAPWVIFSNAAFVGRPETGMRYLDPARDSGDLILDH